MTYSYTCAACRYTFDESGVRVDDRETLRTCPNCGGDAAYDFGATMKDSRHYTQFDDVHFCERKFAQCPTWNPPEGAGTPRNGNVFGPGKKPGVTRFYAGDPRYTKREV